MDEMRRKANDYIKKTSELTEFLKSQIRGLKSGDLDSETADNKLNEFMDKLEERYAL